MVDLAGIEDENERAKAPKRRSEEDRKKALMLKEAEEKAQLKEVEKQQKANGEVLKKGEERGQLTSSRRFRKPNQPLQIPCANRAHRKKEGIYV